MATTKFKKPHIPEGEELRRKDPDYSFVFTGIYYDPNKREKKADAYKRYDERRKQRKAK